MLKHFLSQTQDKGIQLDEDQGSWDLYLIFVMQKREMAESAGKDKTYSNSL